MEYPLMSGVTMYLSWLSTFLCTVWDTKTYILDMFK